MLDIKLIRDDPELAKKDIRDRGGEDTGVVDRVLELDTARRALLEEAEELKHQRNKAGEEIATIKREGGDSSEIVGRMKEISEKIKAMDAELREIEADTRVLMLEIPNIPD